jgi:hypothetical protein
MRVVVAATSKAFRGRSFFEFLILVLLLAAAANAQSAPRVFFSDLEGGPNFGGPSNLGAIVTVYGNGFGATRGASTVTIGGVAVARYYSWSNDKIAFQIGKVLSGNIVVNVGGTSSNGIPFAVRPGRIYFVAPGGSDNHAGSYTDPWRTVLRAKNLMQPGDITYVMDGVVQAGLDSNSASLSVGSSGANGRPKAIVAFPGARVIIGSPKSVKYGIRTPNSGAAYSHWVFAGLIITGYQQAVEVDNSSDWRLVGNDISCPNGSGSGACVNFVNGSQVQLLGNVIHDTGLKTSRSLVNYEAVAFFASDTVNVGWNKITNTSGCRAIAFASSAPDQYALAVHDNFIYNTRCDGISLRGVDPSQGSVRVTNNVVYRAGTGPAPSGGESAYACVNIGGSGLGTAYVLNNTFYDCGARGNADSGGLAASTPVTAVNNIFYATSGESYLTPNTSAAWLAGSNNLFYGAGAAPAPFQNPVTSDPLLVNPAGLDFHLQANSPAIDAGINSGVASDYDGTWRPQGAAYDIGAFEYSGAISTSNGLIQTPSVLSFGTVPVGSSSTQSVTVSNTGASSSTITQMAVTGTNFTAAGLPLPMTLAPGQSSSYTVTFAPKIAGSNTGSVSLTASTASSGTLVAAAATAPSSSVELQGTGASVAGTLSASPGSLSFGTVTVGNSSSQTVTVTAATASVTITQANVTGAGFSVSGLTLPATVAAGQSLSFAVKFAPTVVGTVTGSVALVSNASNTLAITVSGTGASVAGTLSASPGSLSFGTVTVGNSSSQTVTVTAATASVTITQANVTGAGFSVSGLTLPATVAAGQSLSFAVKFAPTVVGTVTGSVALVSNASNTLAITVSGTGAAASVAHSATVSWTASTSANVIGYNVYRGDQSGGPYAKLNSASIMGTTYTDATVVAGGSYYYVVTSLDGTSESSYSAQVSAVIPAP